MAVQGISGAGSQVKPVAPIGAGSYGGSISKGGAVAMSPNQRNAMLKTSGVPISNTANYSADATSRATPGSMFSGAGLGALTPSISGGGQGEELFNVAGKRRGQSISGSRYGFGEQALGGDYGADFGYGQSGAIQGAPIIKYGASWDANEAQKEALWNEYQGEEARWRGRLKTAPIDQPVKKRELPNEPMVKTIEGESTIRSLPKDYSNVYGMGPGRRPVTSSNLGQGNYRLF